MDEINKFTGREKNYAASRPDYAEKLLDCLCSEYGLARAAVADIGSGTGKFSKQLLDRKTLVYCVEPNEDMRREAESTLGKYQNFRSVPGNAENTTLESGSVDHVTVAQAFHWFDPNGFKRECQRITKPGGKVFLIWNFRDNDHVINREWAGIFSQYCPDFGGFGRGIQRDDPKIRTFFDKGYRRVSFDHPLTFNRESFVKRSLSSSYSLQEKDENYEPYIAALNDLFDRHENGGIVTLSNHSVAYIGSI